MRVGRSQMGRMGIFILFAAIALRSAAASIAEGPDDQIWRDKAGAPIPGAYIVTFNDKVASSSEGLARLQEHLAGPGARPQGVAPGAGPAPLLSSEVLGPNAVSVASVDAAAPAETGLKAAVLRFAPTVRAASITDADGDDAAPEASPEAAAIRSSGIVSRVEADRYATIQQDQCVPGAALAGAAPSEAPVVEWAGCATPGATLVWFGERCGPRFDQARYMGVYAIDKATNKPIPGCVMVRNHTVDFNTRWFGDCGSAPAVAASLPVRRFCGPNAAPGKATCVRPTDLEGGLSVQLPQPATCGSVTSRTATFKGIRCGPRGKFVQWSRVSLGDAPAAGATPTPAAADAPEGGDAPVTGPTCARMAKFSRIKRGTVPPIMANAEMVGACGVPPIAHKELSIEVCDFGQNDVPKPLELPHPVTKVPEVAANPEEELPWGIPRIEAIVGGKVTAALPISVAVIDTGIDETHPDLNVAGGVSFVGTSFADGNGHGTHVAGTIGARNNGAGVIGVAPDTPIWALRVLDARGSGAFSAIVNALLWVAKNGRSKNIRVINMSLGGDGGSDPTSSAICDAIRDVNAAGIAVVAAAGNAGPNGPRTWTNNLPAACPGVLVVTAIDPSNGPAKFSYFLGPTESANAASKGRTIAAPGVDVKSTWARDLGRGDYRSISGTSMASPHVAGVTAKCFATGVCTGGTQAIDAVVADAVARNMGDEAYGFRGDPFFGRSKIGEDRYFGPLVHAGWRN